MNILFVSMVAFENNSSATIRNKGLVKGFHELGHSIDIMTLKPELEASSYDNTMNDVVKFINEKYYIELDSKYEKLMAKKYVVNKELSYDKRIKAFKHIRKIIKKIYYSISIFDAQIVNVKGVSKVDIDLNKYDIIISSSDPKSSHLIVKRILKEKQNCKARWIQYWGDPMYNDITRKKDWRNGLIRFNEKKLISLADRVVYASPLTLDIQKKTFPKLANKMDYASQVCAKTDDKSNIYLTESKVLLIIGYFGGYSSLVRNIIPLYNAVKDSEFLLNISGGSDVKLENTVNIKIHGMLSYKEVSEMEEKSDILVAICNSSGTQIPGKIYYCAGYNKPVIVILDGEHIDDLRTYFESFNRYILCENNEESIKLAFEKAKKQISRQYKIDEKLTPKYLAKKILS